MDFTPVLESKVNPVGRSRGRTVEKERTSWYQKSEQVDLLEDKGWAVLQHAHTLLPCI